MNAIQFELSFRNISKIKCSTPALEIAEKPRNKKMTKSKIWLFIKGFVFIIIIIIYYYF